MLGIVKDDERACAWGSNKGCFEDDIKKRSKGLTSKDNIIAADSCEYSSKVYLGRCQAEFQVGRGDG